MRPTTPPPRAADAGNAGRERRSLASLEATLLDSPAGPSLKALGARLHQRRVDTALSGPFKGTVVADVLFRAVTGRTASRKEIRRLREAVASGRSLAEEVQALRETPEASKLTLDGIRPAIRTWMRSQFESGQVEFETPRLVFLHFMKVGGTSVSDQLARWFGADRAWVHLFVDDLALAPAPLLANLRVIAGHIPFAALPLVPGSYRTMAVLRDPLSRTLSHYSHTKEVNPLKRDMTLEQFVFDEESSFSGNHQARYLAHDVDLAGAWRTYSPEERFAQIGGDRLTENPLQVLFDIGPTLPEEELLKRARENLDQIDIVGVTDDLDRVASSVAELFELPGVHLGRLNKSTPVERKDLSDRIRNKIEERTAVDRELYEQARNRLAGRG